MSISTAQIAAVPDYTDAEMVKMLRAAIIGVTVAGSYTMPTGVQVTRANLKDLMTALEMFEARVNASEEGNGIALIQLGERV